MSDCSSQQITISQLIEKGMIYEIPDYQRGYRWGRTEVIDFLEDIKDIVKEDLNDGPLREMCQRRPYCLQPLSFDCAKENDNIMIVVDGQQRLTTIFLVLYYIKSQFIAISPENKKLLGIKNTDEYCKEIMLRYADPSRERIFEDVKNNLEQKNSQNIDAYYITEAYSVIKEWGDENLSDLNLLKHFAIKLLYGTSVIWYEVDSSTDGTPSEFFAKTNTGKIPLTNSELIKAVLMLDEYCLKKTTSVLDDNDLDKSKKEDEQKRFNLEKLENQRIKISRQWDSIENALRNDEFWYFLTENTDEYEDTRIDFIFDIIAKELYSDLNLGYNSVEEFFELNKERGSFIIIARYLKEFEHRDDNEPNADPIGVYVWKKAWNTYMTFKEWFENREWYHFIGFLLSEDDELTAETILNVFQDNQYNSKIEIKEKVISMIKDRGYLTIEDANGKRVDRTKDEYVDYLRTLDYDKNDNKKIISRVLLLFNVVWVLSDNNKSTNSSRDTFFPFSRYKKEKWNLEHIHSKADGNFSRDFGKEYINYINEMLKRIEKDKSANRQEKETLKKIYNKYEERYAALTQAGYKDEDAVTMAAQESCDLWIEKFGDDLEDKYINGLGNMALLDAKTNQSYHNAPFFMKRMIISDIVLGKKKETSRFIPFCTRNVFDKTYTKLPKAMLHWNNEDYNDYLETIASVIYNYFG